MLHVTHLPGTWGPLIKIDADNMDDLLYMKKIFQELSTQTRTQITLKDEPKVRFTKVSSITLRTVPTEDKRRVKMVGNNSDGPSVEWSRTRDGWEWCADM